MTEKAPYKTEKSFGVKNNSKIFNMHQQLLESKTLQTVLSENEEKGIVEYLETKQFAKDDLPKMILTKKKSQ